MSGLDVAPQEVKRAKNSGVPLMQTKTNLFIKKAQFLFFFSPKSRIKEDTVSFCYQLNKVTKKLLTSLLTFPLSWNNLGQLLWFIMEKNENSKQ